MSRGARRKFTRRVETPGEAVTMAVLAMAEAAQTQASIDLVVTFPGGSLHLVRSEYSARADGLWPTVRAREGGG